VRDISWEVRRWMEVVYFIVMLTINMSWTSLKQNVMKGRLLGAKHLVTHVRERRGVKKKSLRRNNVS
jgi:hypothetical protein